MSDAVDLQIVWDVLIPLRDGIRLNATVYMPRRESARRPCILMMTPYIADTHHSRGVYFATRELIVAIVDVRGRGNSEGVFRPNIQEATDGYDVVEWLASQPYCNGKVAMLGGSYLGYVQWATAKEFPPHLATIVPAAAPYQGMEFPMRNNIFFPYLVQWLTFTSGSAARTQIFSDTAFWSRFFREWHESGRSFRGLDAMLGSPYPVFQEWLDHPEPDAYWDAYNPTVEQYARLEIPILTITGSYDDDQPGALEHYKQHLRNASPSAKARHYLVIGPWDHLRTGWAPSEAFGGLEVGRASLVDMPKLHLDWYAWTMQNGPKPEFLKNSVAYYVMGSERWRYAESLEAITGSYLTYYLDSTGTANDIFASGSLGPVTGRGPPDSYTYDPSDAHAPEIVAESRTAGDSLVDQSVALALRGRLLVYHSRPFEHDTEVSGFFKLHAWLSIDCPDTDFFVSIHEVASNGQCIRLTTDAIRARYREGVRSPKLISTRDSLRYDFDRFTFVSRDISKGHRLRLVIAPMGRLVESTFAQKNYNAGGTVSEESIEDARPVTVRMFHDEVHLSALFIPLGQIERSAESSVPPRSFSSAGDSTQ
jgi:putative CocE/NonD family hydrolase